MKERPSVAVFWFRRDLRLHDNHGLYQALTQYENVLPVFVFDRSILDPLRDQRDKRVTFIHQTLAHIDAELREMGSGLLTFYGSPKDAFQQLQRDYDLSAVFCNRDYEPSAKRRDKEIADLLQETSTPFFDFKDQVVQISADARSDAVLVAQAVASLSKVGVRQITLLTLRQ